LRRAGLIARAYAAFNRRDIDGALALLSGGIDWPKASEGGREVGQDGIRAKWTRQWAAFDPRVEPVAMTEREPGVVDVQARQTVKTLSGEVVSELMVSHVFTLNGGLIKRMDVGGGDGAFGRS